MFVFRATRQVLAKRRIRGLPQIPGREEKLSKKEEKLADLMRPLEKPPPHKPEERERLRALMIRYGKLKRLQHLEMEKRRQNAFRGMWAAIDAMPHQRRVEAIEAKPMQPKMKLPVFTHTPPITGFDLGNLQNE